MFEALSETAAALGTASIHFIDIQSLTYLSIGTCIGLLFGAMPGLGGATALATERIVGAAPGAPKAIVGYWKTPSSRRATIRKSRPGQRRPTRTWIRQRRKARRSASATWSGSIPNTTTR
jgi:hypothetical protein